MALENFENSPKESEDPPLQQLAGILSIILRKGFKKLTKQDASDLKLFHGSESPLTKLDNRGPLFTTDSPQGAKGYSDLRPTGAISQLTARPGNVSYIKDLEDIGLVEDGKLSPWGEEIMEVNREAPPGAGILELISQEQVQDILKGGGIDYHIQRDLLPYLSEGYDKTDPFLDALIALEPADSLKIIRSLGIVE